MGLFKKLKELKPERKHYRIKPTIKFMKDKHDYCFSFLPTIIWSPWIYRYPRLAVVDIWWLHFHILIGTWVPLETSCWKEW